MSRPEQYVESRRCATHDQLTIFQIYQKLGRNQGIPEPEYGQLGDARLPPDAMTSFLYFLADVRAFRFRRRRRRED